MTSRPAKDALGPLFYSGVILAGAFAATCALVLAFNSRPVISVAAAGGALCVILAVVSQNPRLFFLCSLMFVMPLDLSRRFKPMPHFGGEWALRIELADIFLLVLLCFWIHDIIKDRAKIIRIPNAIIAWGLMIVLAAVQIYFITFRTVSAYEMIKMTKMFVLFVFLVNNIKSAKQLEYVSGMLALGVLIQALYGISQQFFGASFGLEVLGEAQQVLQQPLGLRSASRVGAMLGHPNVFACYLAMSLPVCAALMLCRGSIPFRILCFAALMTGAAALVFTRSRGGWGGFGIAFGMVIAGSFMHPRLARRGIALRILMVIIMCGLGILFAPAVIERITQSGSEAVDARLIWLGVAWKMIRTHFWKGIGLNNYGYVTRDYDTSGIDWGYPGPPVHNIYMLTWSETGIFGILLFVGMMGLFLYQGIKNLRCRDEFLLSLNLGILAGVCAVLIQGLADWLYRVNPVQRTFFALAALLFVIERLSAEQNGNHENKSAASGPGGESAALGGASSVEEP